MKQLFITLTVYLIKMKKVQISFDFNGHDIYVLANYYKGCDATLEEPAEEPSFDIIELTCTITPKDCFIDAVVKKIGLPNIMELESVEDLSEHLQVSEDDLNNIILSHIQDYFKNEQYFPNW